MSRPTRGSHDALPVRACHPLWSAVPDASGSRRTTTGLVPVRSPLLRESRLMSFPPGTEMVQFPGFAPPTAPTRPTVPQKRWVAPFGDPRIDGCSPLPAAYRSVPRPSSPLGAKASTRCPSLARPAPAPEPHGPRNRNARAYPADDRPPPTKRERSYPPRTAERPRATSNPLHDVQTSHHPPDRRSDWWARAESNGRPHPYQGCALTG